MRSKILIIKLGALGDVIRTTPLLHRHILDGDIYWVTRKEAIPLLPKNILKEVISIEEAKSLLQDQYFDLVISLDDDYEAAELASMVKKNIIIGSFLDETGKVTYTESSSEWFDMGLISKYGKEVADELKKKNTKTYQEIIFRMIGKEFKGEEYIINYDFNKTKKESSGTKIIGIESRAGDRWPTKKWNKYKELAELLTKDGYEVRFFSQRERLEQYIEDISECDLVVTGDTLALHLALALKVKVVAIFTCTSPTEIYDYNRMIKVVSPLLDMAFYKRSYIQEVVDAVSLGEVYKAVKNLIGDGL